MTATRDVHCRYLLPPPSRGWHAPHGVIPAGTAGPGMVGPHYTVITLRGVIAAGGCSPGGAGT